MRNSDLFLILQAGSSGWSDPGEGEWQSGRLAEAVQAYSIPNLVECLSQTWGIPEAEVADAIRSIHYARGWCDREEDWRELVALSSAEAVRRAKE